jgi:hypothetical protein
MQLFLKITKVFGIFGRLFPQLSLRNNFDKKTGWATFWATLSQTHLVTLPREPTDFK